MSTRYIGNAPELRHMFVPYKGNEQFHMFSSPETMAEHVKSQGQGWHSSTWAATSERKSFTGVRTMGEAITLAMDGWREGAERAARIRDRICALRPSTRKLATYGVAGALPNIPRYLAGNPAHMLMVQSVKSRQRPVLTLISDMGANCYIGADTFINRAAVIAAIVDVIEDAGYSCHVVGYFATAGARVMARAAVTLKEPSQPVDVARLAYGLGHTAMFRRLGFALITENEFTSAMGSGLGHTEQLTKSKVTERDVFILPSVESLSGYFSTENEACTKGLDKMIESLTQQECPAFAG
jgi:hypothetical protein